MRRDSRPTICYATPVQDFIQTEFRFQLKGYVRVEIGKFTFTLYSPWDRLSASEGETCTQLKVGAVAVIYPYGRGLNVCSLMRRLDIRSRHWLRASAAAWRFSLVP